MNKEERNDDTDSMIRVWQKKQRGTRRQKKKKRVPYVTRHFWVYKHILESTCVCVCVCFGHTHTPQDNGEQQIIAKKE